MLLMRDDTMVQIASGKPNSIKELQKYRDIKNNTLNFHGDAILRCVDIDRDDNGNAVIDAETSATLKPPKEW